jgi:hypothetical protein
MIASLAFHDVQKTGKTLAVHTHSMNSHATRSSAAMTLDSTWTKLAVEYLAIKRFASHDQLQ